MIESLKLIELVEESGNELRLEGGHLRITKGKALETALKEKVINNKNEIIEILQCDQRAREHALMVGLRGTLYFASLTDFTTVYIEHINGEFCCWKETFLQGRSKSVKYETISQGGPLDSVLMEFEEYLKNS
jgi:hypothetical protein